MLQCNILNYEIKKEKFFYEVREALTAPRVGQWRYYYCHTTEGLNSTCNEYRFYVCLGFTIWRFRAVAAHQTFAHGNVRLVAYISSIQLETVTR